MRRLIPLLALALALSGCLRVTVRRTVTTGSPSRPAPNMVPTPYEAGAPAARPGLVPKGSATPRGTAAGAAPGETEVNPSSHFPVAFDMPSCIERTRPARATIRTAKLSMIIASAAYADGENHGGVWTGSTDGSGSYALAWTPPPDAPLGAAKILVGVNGEQGGATAQRHFVLAAPGGCR